MFREFPDAEDYPAEIFCFGGMSCVLSGKIYSDFYKKGNTFSDLMQRQCQHLISFRAHKEVFKLFDVFKKYDFNSFDVKAHKFYRQKEITSNNANVLVTGYACPEGEKLIVPGNRTKQPQKAVIDLGKVTGNTVKLREEFYKKDITASNGKISVTVPARAFLLIGTKKSRGWTKRTWWTTRVSTE